MGKGDQASSRKAARQTQSRVLSIVWPLQGLGNMNDHRTFCIYAKLDTGAWACLHRFTHRPSRIVWRWFCEFRQGLPRHEFRLSSIPAVDTAPLGIPPWATIRRELRKVRGVTVRIAE